MAQLDLPEIRQKVRQVIAGTPLANQVADIRVAVAEAGEEDVLRIFIELRRPKTVGYSALADVVTRIEDAFVDSEERFPSVRFSEAA